jgi:hypothetical protein
MDEVVGTHVIEGIAYEVHGARYMYPETDENGLPVRRNGLYDYYDIYTYGTGRLTCLTCVNEGRPFMTIPTEKELRDFLEV